MKFKKVSIIIISSLRPAHWFQFADDAAAVTGQESENQVLLNHFSNGATGLICLSESTNALYFASESRYLSLFNFNRNF